MPEVYILVFPVASGHSLWVEGQVSPPVDYVKANGFKRFLVFKENEDWPPKNRTGIWIRDCVSQF